MERENKNCGEERFGRRHRSRIEVVSSEDGLRNERENIKWRIREEIMEASKEVR